VLQPVAGVVFVLDGILIGAGDGAYLAVTTLVATVVFLPAAIAAYRADAGLVGLWTAIGLWMLTRMLTLGLRARGDRWMVTGAVR
jgi:Na+-driven multidrug efflux pump